MPVSAVLGALDQLLARDREAIAQRLARKRYSRSYDDAVLAAMRAV